MTAIRRPGELHALSIGIIGAGRMARQHAAAIQQSPQPTRIVGIADPSSETLQDLDAWAEDETASFRSATELLQVAKPDVVHICTPAVTHAALAMEALDAGSHVYVEKPFALRSVEAQRILELAHRRDLQVCAGHQLLFQQVLRRFRRLAPAVGRRIYAQSYFSFAPSRRSYSEGLPGLGPLEQLVDVLPHPVYLLLAALGEPQESATIVQQTPGADGSLHATIEKGGAVGHLTISLTARPVDSYLRLVGSNGQLHADLVRDVLQTSIGPGTSSIEKAARPYREAAQLIAGTTRSLAGRLTGRSRSYPGLEPLVTAFYRSVVESDPPPLTPGQISETVEICEEIVEGSSTIGKTRQGSKSEARTERHGDVVLVTGASGFLGEAVARELRRDGRRVRALMRSTPVPWSEHPWDEHVVADLASDPLAEALQGVTCVVHCAAETRGGFQAHQRNSVHASERLVEAMDREGVARILHVSSLGAVAGTEAPVDESSSLLGPEDRTAGPYAWGKACSERRVREMCRTRDLDLCVARPAPIYDPSDFAPPGRLGRTLGRTFVAVGHPDETIPVVSLPLAARTLAAIVEHFDTAPDTIHLFDLDLPSRRVLVRKLRAARPDLRILWLPRFTLGPISLMARLFQRVLRPGRSPVDLKTIFRNERHDGRRIRHFVEAVTSSTEESASMALGTSPFQSSNADQRREGDGDPPREIDREA